MSDHCDKPKKILFVTSDTFPPYRPAAKAIFSEELTKKGYIIDWLLQADKSSSSNSRVVKYGTGNAYIGGTNNGPHYLHRIKNVFLGVANDLKVFSLVKRNSYDIVQIKDKFVLALLALLAVKLVRKDKRPKVMYWLAYPYPEASLYAAEIGVARNPWLNRLRGNLYRILLYKVIMHESVHVFVQSDQMKKDVHAEGIALNKMTPVPGSLYLADVPYGTSSSYEKWEDMKGVKSIVYVGTFDRVRQLDFLIRVFSMVYENDHNCRMYMIGKGQTREDTELLENEATKLGIRDVVIFTGYLPMEEAWECIRWSDVCVSPYYPTPILNSTSPTKLIEYMAMGKAVVGNDHPEQSAVIAESGAGICVPWNEKKFSEALLKILGDPKMGEVMGANGRKYVEEYRTNSVMADVVDNEYKRHL